MRKFTKLSQRCLLVLLMAAGTNLAFAQIKVSGKVNDGSSSGSLPGVNVVIKGSTTGAITDIDGNYNIEVPSAESVLQFSFIGYVDQEVVVGSNSTIDITLVEDLKQLEEVVVIGYGQQKKKEVTGAVASMKSDAILKTVTSDLAESMQGQIAGVNIQAADGRPGGGSNVQIRGVGSLSANGRNRDAIPVFNNPQGPLYVVDGIPQQGNPNIPPEQVESIDVLKDGASAAIYGVRASNGVILITTKRGSGEMKVDFRTYKGVQNITSGTPLMNTRQQLYAADIVQEGLGNSTPSIFIRSPEALEFDSDFVGDVQNQNAAIENYSISVSGGTESMKLNVSSNYFKQDGVLINSGFDRLSTRITGEFQRDRFKAFATVAFTNESSTKEPWGLYSYAINQAPYQRGLFQVPTVGENEVQIDGENEILYSFISRELDNEDDRKVNSSNIALKLDYEIIDGLNYSVNLGRNTWNFRRKFFRPQYLVYDRNGDYSPTASRPDAILEQRFIFNRRNVIENVLSYAKEIGDHSFNVLAGLTYEKFENSSVGVGVSGLLSNDTRVLGAGSDGIPPTGTDNVNTLAGKIGRVQYNYADRYLLSATVRRDGSSNFGPGNKYETFYGVSAGWNITEESFFENLGLDFITNLKLRLSYGEVGNQSIGSYRFADVILSGVDYVFGENEYLASGAIQRGLANPSVQWETNISRNIGLDADLLEGRINVTLDYYNNEKQDMLLPQRLAPNSGTSPDRYDWAFRNIFVNAGNMTNKGLEAALTYRQKTDIGLNWNTTLTFTKNTNTVTDLDGAGRFQYSGGDPIGGVNGIIGDATTYLVEGYEAGAFFLIPTDGTIKSDTPNGAVHGTHPDTSEELSELTAYQLMVPEANLGDLKYVDTNNDGAIDDNDRVYHGSGQAKFETGLSVGATYKGFDFYVQTYYVHDPKIFNGAKMYAYTAGRHLDHYYAWTPQNPTSDIPAFRQSAEHNNVRSRSNYFLEDGTYLRIRNITLGYSLPQSVLNNKFSKVRVYFSSLNPFTFTKYTGYDPEVGGDGLFTRGVDIGNYPVSRRFTAGLEVQF